MDITHTAHFNIHYFSNTQYRSYSNDQIEKNLLDMIRLIGGFPSVS